MTENNLPPNVIQTKKGNSVVSSDKKSDILDFIIYSLKNAPWALIGSLSAAVANYIILILLSKAYGIAASGEFRLLLSIFGMLSLLTLMDTGKVAIKYLVQGESGVIRPLFVQRVLFGLSGSLLGVLITIYYKMDDNPLWITLAIMALLVPIVRPMGLLFQINQSKKLFKKNALIRIAIYGTIVCTCLIVTQLEIDRIVFFSSFFITLAVFHGFLFMRYHEVHERSHPNAQQMKRESRRLSYSGAFPIVLEHADKFLVSYFLGIEALGIYVIGVSTGRLLERFIKPSLSIYFPHLVNHRLDFRLIALGFLLLSIFAIFAYFGVNFYFVEILGTEYKDSAPIALVIIAGLGFSFIGIIVYYSAIYHRDSDISVPVVANIGTTVFIVTYLTLAILYGGRYALMLCAASYPLRDFVQMIFVKAMERRNARSIDR